jgi:hypothetical protein
MRRSTGPVIAAFYGKPIAAREMELLARAASLELQHCDAFAGSTSVIRQPRRAFNRRWLRRLHE